MRGGSTRSIVDVSLRVLAALAAIGALVEYRAHGLTLVPVVFVSVVAVTMLREWRRSRGEG